MLSLAVVVSFAQTSGQAQGTPGRRPPAKRPESGLPGRTGATNKPGSHESAAKDERDRIAGKFPAPKESQNESDAARPTPRAATADIDVVVLEGRRQALTLARDDFRVAIDGEPRRIVAVHYVFRGPQALEAGRSIPLGRAVVARADESRAIVVALDGTTAAPSSDETFTAAVTHTLDLIGHSDRAAIVTLPAAIPISFAADRGDLLGRADAIAARVSATPGSDSVLDALSRVFSDLGRLRGPKVVILLQASAALARPAGAPAIEKWPDSSRALDAAAASRTTLHLVTARGVFAPAYLRTLARSTGGVVTRLTGEPRDLEPLATALLGGYVLQVESYAGDRDGRVHSVVVTTGRRGTRVLAAARWMPHSEPLPPVVVY